LKKFAAEMFNRCPLLTDFLKNQDIEAIYNGFLAYKMKIPVCGAIILNPSRDKVLLVKGWNSSSAWTFPKGKINEREGEIECAIREVIEETGFDMSSFINSSDYIEQVLRGEQRNRLYIVSGISEHTKFYPKVRKEISDIMWHRIQFLPGYRRKDGSVVSSSDCDTKYYMIRNFIDALQKWIKKSPQNNKYNRTRSKSCSGNPFVNENSRHSSFPKISEHNDVLKQILGIPTDTKSKKDNVFATSSSFVAPSDPLNPFNESPYQSPRINSANNNESSNNNSNNNREGISGRSKKFSKTPENSKNEISKKKIIILSKNTGQ
jgi:mRNA-decapping enzyme subunit 2